MNMIVKIIKKYNQTGREPLLQMTNFMACSSLNSTKVNLIYFY